MAREILKIWQVKVKVLPVVVGALGTIPEALGDISRRNGN